MRAMIAAAVALLANAFTARAAVMMEVPWDEGGGASQRPPSSAFGGVGGSDYDHFIGGDEYKNNPDVVAGEDGRLYWFNKSGELDSVTDPALSRTFLYPPGPPDMFLDVNALKAKQRRKAADIAKAKAEAEALAEANKNAWPSSRPGGGTRAGGDGGSQSEAPGADSASTETGGGKDDDLDRAADDLVDEAKDSYAVLSSESPDGSIQISAQGPLANLGNVPRTRSATQLGEAAGYANSSSDAAQAGSSGPLNDPTLMQTIGEWFSFFAKGRKDLPSNVDVKPGKLPTGTQMFQDGKKRPDGI